MKFHPFFWVIVILLLVVVYESVFGGAHKQIEESRPKTPRGRFPNVVVDIMAMIMVFVFLTLAF